LVAGPSGADGPTLSISIGAACFAGGRSDLAGLLAAADRALYRAKAQGRDRVVLA
jgi:diguanylate cyclase (GGDEF)-like protein